MDASKQSWRVAFNRRDRGKARRVVSAANKGLELRNFRAGNNSVFLAPLAWFVFATRG